MCCLYKMYKFTNDHIFSALTKQFPDLAPLRSLLAGLVVPRQQHDVTDMIDSSAQCDDTTPQPLRPSSPWLPSQLAPFMKKLNSKDSGGLKPSVTITYKCTGLHVLDFM